MNDIIRSLKERRSVRTYRNEQISEVKEIRIGGAFTRIEEGVFELENKADVYIYCQLDLSDRAFGKQDVKIYVPEDIKISPITIEELFLFMVKEAK